MSFALVYVALPMVTVLGLAFAWYFRPQGWFGQKIAFFGSTARCATPPPVARRPGTEFIAELKETIFPTDDPVPHCTAVHTQAVIDGKQYDKITTFLEYPDAKQLEICRHNHRQAFLRLCATIKA